MTWLTYALLSALFAGLVAIFGKIGVREVDSTLATMVRSVVMAVTLVSLVLARGDIGNVKQITQRAWLFIVFAGIAGAASWLCYFRALQLGDAVRVAPIDKLSIIFVVIFGAMFLGEKMTVGVIAGSLLVLGGAILIARG
ncbi:MAG: EamA family transporter [Pyrinomonadaceae bacterium]